MNGFPLREWRARNALQLVFAGLAILFTHQGAGHGAQLTYSKGQTIAPAYEGWEQLADGTQDFIWVRLYCVDAKGGIRDHFTTRSRERFAVRREGPAGRVSDGIFPFAYCAA